MSSRALLLSVRPEFADGILSKGKTVELRRLRPRLERGDTVILYATSPRRAIVGMFIVDGLVEAAPATLWRTVKDVCGISRSAFNHYFDGAATGFAIKVRRVQTFRQPISLQTIRDAAPGFRPPQGYHYLRCDRETDRALAALVAA